MALIDRRRWLAGAAASAVAGRAAAEGVKRRMYDYLFVDLDTPLGGRPYAGYLKQVEARAAEIEREGGQLLGFFTPQLGWRTGQAALLVGWAPDAGARDRLMGELAGLQGVRDARRDRLEATARPAPADRPQAGGVYVHRWFVIDTPSLDEVVSLSTEAWRGFERDFDARIFGLLKAAQTPEDQARGLTRLLLLTRYGDHSVWEASREPAEEAKAAFARRHQLARETWAASTLVRTF